MLWVPLGPPNDRSLTMSSSKRSALLAVLLLAAAATTACSSDATAPSPNFDTTCTETQGSGTRCQ